MARRLIQVSFFASLLLYTVMAPAARSYFWLSLLLTTSFGSIITGFVFRWVFFTGVISTHRRIR